MNEYLHEVDIQCYERLELLVEQMKAGTGITEELKATDQMKWVGLMNNVRTQRRFSPCCARSRPPRARHPVGARSAHG